MISRGCKSSGEPLGFGGRIAARLSVLQMLVEVGWAIGGQLAGQIIVEAIAMGFRP
jgi:hypothetical protein